MEFNVEKMQLLKDNDSVVRFMADNLKGKGMTEEEILKTVFVSEVLGDSEMERKYNK